MPKEKSLFLIGVWIIVLSHFVGISTDIKNYLFIATGVLLVFISYGSYVLSKKKEESFTKEVEVLKTVKIETFEQKAKEPKEEEPKPKKIRNRIIESLRNTETPKEEESMISTISYEDIKKEYEPKIKVRRARIKAVVKKPVQDVYSFNNYGEEDDDVVVISRGKEE